MSKSIRGFNGEYAFLSNFIYAPGHFIRGEFTSTCEMLYPTVEHAYQAVKTRLYAEKVMIQKAKTPALAKKIGRGVTLRPDWEGIKVTVMLDLLRQKFKHPDYSAQLLATGDAELIEVTTKNNLFWGMWENEGQNWLGRLLMQVRQEIRNG